MLIVQNYYHSMRPYNDSLLLPSDQHLCQIASTPVVSAAVNSFSALMSSHSSGATREESAGIFFESITAKFICRRRPVAVD